MNLKKNAENHEKKILIIFVLIDLNLENKKDIAFLLKVKTHIQNANVKTR